MDRIMARNFEVDILWGGGGGWLDLPPCPRRSLPMGMPPAGPGSISREGGRRNSKYSTESTVQVAVLCQLTSPPFTTHGPQLSLTAVKSPVLPLTSV